ncbi:hypothetical protein V2S66_18720 [Streptomyces sp. V4-01]|uniref:Uncharacterized protein n=1 Tax=Actinacidiphila polyblastidii TaxID=3110430 RepID=A0ABU7PDV8_9ACTN|nr:hypothetical protein [Streptomyces sp. V4-01]
MNAAEMPTTQDTAIVEALGRPLTVLYTQAVAGTAEPAVQRVLELRSFLALVEDQAAKICHRIRLAVDPAGDLYGADPQHLRFQTALLEAALETGRTYRRTLQELLAVTPAASPPNRRPVQFTQSKIAAISAPDGRLTARPGPAGEPVVEAGAGRHRR